MEKLSVEQRPEAAELEGLRQRLQRLEAENQKLSGQLRRSEAQRYAACSFASWTDSRPGLWEPNSPCFKPGNP